MSDNENANPAIKFIWTLTEQIFERVIRGEYNYAKDIRSLGRYQEQAKKLGSIWLEARILNTRAVLESVSGHSEESIAIFYDVYSLYEQIDEKSRMASVLGNIALVQITQGKYEDAYANCEQGMMLIAPEDDYAVYRFLLSTKLKVAFIQQKYDEVDTTFEEIEVMLTQFESADKHKYARYMCEIYRVMAERELMRENFEQSRSYVNLATEFAEGLSLTFELAEIYCTHAHIVLKRSEDIILAEEYWQKASRVLADVESPSHLGHYYIKEARYLKRHNYVEKATEFAQYALDIFEEAEMTEGAILAQALLPADF